MTPTTKPVGTITHRAYCTPRGAIMLEVRQDGERAYLFGPFDDLMQRTAFIVKMRLGEPTRQRFFKPDKLTTTS